MEVKICQKLNSKKITETITGSINIPIKTKR